jgi:hypothetical protein
VDLLSADWWATATDLYSVDAHGIRPAYYFADDEIIIAASERSAYALFLMWEKMKY